MQTAIPVAFLTALIASLIAVFGKREYSLSIFVMSILAGIVVAVVSLLFGGIFGGVFDTTLFTEGVLLTDLLIDWLVQSFIGALIPPLAEYFISIKLE
ncbi:MAG: hypothetical protein DRJ03_25295 [Chloroflexi bacterium]|nr:MAG: hypothetical protein DRJ03_25295 [Chloroflexota bacterium]